jgi:hypothetical protein
MKLENLAKLPKNEFAKLEIELAHLKTLGQILTWAGTKPKGDFVSQIVLEVITQDEFTHDIIVPYRDLFLVFDTT